MDDLDAYCATLKAQIKKQYEKSQHNRGWRFLYSPRRVLNGAKVAFLGLNPGVDPETRGFEPREGSAYEKEKWYYRDERRPPGQAPLQKRVQALFTKIGVQPKDVLTGNLVPFCTAEWQHVRNRKFSIQFGKELWECIFRRARPSLIIGMGEDTFSSLYSILNAREEEEVALRWKTQKGKCATLPGRRARFGDDGLLVGLPHLSRNGIVSNPTSHPDLCRLFGNDF